MRRRGDATAIPMEFEMYVMPTFEFLRLSELVSHEKLMREGKLVRVDDSMNTIFYVSHEWTSLKHPDHSTAQLHTFQAVLLRMLRGALPETTPTFTDAIRLPKSVNITSSQWQWLVKDSFVWVDAISVRQERGGGVMVMVSALTVANIRHCHTQMPSKDREDVYEMANRSIAGYIERSSHFFAVVPTVKHGDNDDVTCDYGSWLRSACNRFELFALLLSRHERAPPIVRPNAACARRRSQIFTAAYEARLKFLCFLCHR